MTFALSLLTGIALGLAFAWCVRKLRAWREQREADAFAKEYARREGLDLSGLPVDVAQQRLTPYTRALWLNEHNPDGTKRWPKRRLG